MTKKKGNKPCNTTKKPAPERPFPNNQGTKPSKVKKG